MDGSSARVPGLSRRSFALFITIVCAVCVITYTINAHYDVSALDQGALITRLAKAQSDSDLLVWQDAFDQRAWLKERLLDPRADEQLLVLSSSTLGGLSQAMFPRRAVLNGWLSAPTIEDFEASTVLLDHAPHKPPIVVLGIDAWFLNPVIDDQRWRSLTAEYIAYHRAEGEGVQVYAQKPLRWWATFKERLTFATLRETLLFVRRAHRASEPIRPWLVRATPEEYCSRISAEEYIRTAVGDYVSCPALRNPQAVVDSEATTYLSLNTHSMAEWRVVDRSRAARLEAAIEHIRNDGESVVVVAPPYHPITYAALRANPNTARNLDEVDRILSEMAHRTGAEYVNLRDPSDLGCVAEDFLDSHHTKASCGRKIAERIAAAADVLAGSRQPR